MLYSRNRLIISLTALLVITTSLVEAAAQNTLAKQITTAGNFLTYENTTYGIKMLYPSNWNKEQNLSSGSLNNSKLVDVVRFSPRFENVTSNTPTENLEVKVDNISDIQPITLAKYTNYSIEDLRKDFKVISLDRNATVGGNNPAYKVVYTGIEQDVNLHGMIIYTIKDERAYIISYMAEPSKYSSDLPMVQRMLDSIELTK